MDVGGGWGGGREIGGRNKGAHKTFQPPHPDGWIHHKHLDNPKEVRMAGAGSDDTNTQHINHLHSLGSSPTPSRPAATSGDWNHIQECRGGGGPRHAGQQTKWAQRDIFTGVWALLSGQRGILLGLDSR